MIMFEDAARHIDADTLADLDGGMVRALERVDELGMAPRPTDDPRLLAGGALGRGRGQQSGIEVYMVSRLEIDQASVTDNDVERQIEFTAKIDGDERDLAVEYGVLKELSGDEPEDDALDLFERFSDQIADLCADAAEQQPSANVVTIDEGDLE